MSENRINVTQTETKQAYRQAQSSSDMSVYKSSAEESVIHKRSKGLSLFEGSEEYFSQTYDHCSDVGNHVEAEGFCTKCDDYRCGRCFRSHSGNKASRDHVLLDKDDIPKQSNPVYDPCKLAGYGVEAEEKCTDCDENLCSTCHRSHSRSTASNYNVLLDKDGMPRKRKACASAVSKLNIEKQDGDSQNYVEEYTYIRDIYVASADDEKDCYIIGMACVSRNELLLLDLNNESIKLIDIENDVIKNSLKLEKKPVGLTMISKDHAAVVLQNKCKIIIVSVSEGLSVLRTLNTNGESVDVKSFNGKIYVSFRKPVQFQILHPSGEVYKTIKPDPEVLQYSNLPRYIAVSPDESMIYISDWKNNKMLSIDMNGKLVSAFRGEIDQPHDITISPTGSVYLCNRRQDAVYKMSPDLNEATVILGQEHGLFSPMAMCVSFNRKNIFISSGSKETIYCNFIKAYRWR